MNSYYKFLLFRSLSNHGKIQQWHVHNVSDNITGNSEAYVMQYSPCLTFIFYSAAFRPLNRDAASGICKKLERLSL